jgi:hypothetical protein
MRSGSTPEPVRGLGGSVGTKYQSVCSELRSAVDRGNDPESYNCERQKIKPVESFMVPV